MDVDKGVWSTKTLSRRPFRGGHSGVAVLGGKIYVISGFQDSARKLQIYDPAQNTWSLGPEVPWDGQGSPNVAVMGEKILVCGGLQPYDKHNHKECAKYDPRTNRWEFVAGMLLGVNHAAFGTDGQQLYVFGGRTNRVNSPGDGISTVQIYNDTADTWTFGPEMPVPRSGMGHAPLFNGDFYVIGGEAATRKEHVTSDFTYKLVHMYDPASRSWRRGPDLPIGLHGIYPVTDEPNNRIIVAGGAWREGKTKVDSTWVLH